jgi:hypothetical protein
MSRAPRLAIACLCGLLLIHLPPLAGVGSAEALRSAYGLGALDAQTVLLLQHRAVQFGLLALGLGIAVRLPAWRAPMLLAVAISDAGFVVLALGAAELGAPLRVVMGFDLLALVLAGIAALALRRAKPVGAQ